MKKFYSVFILILIILGLITLLAWVAPKNDTNEFSKKNNQKTMETQNNEGLKIEIIKEGEGEVAQNGQMISVHYTGMLESGVVFDSSVQRGTPIQFSLGTGRVIKGWDLGVVGMKIGEKRKLTIPAELAYGERGVTLPDGTILIPGGATLIFDVELVGVKQQ